MQTESKQRDREDPGESDTHRHGKRKKGREEDQRGSRGTTGWTKMQGDAALIIPSMCQKSGCWHVLLLHFHHEMYNFLNVTCSFQGFHPSEAGRQKWTGAACHKLWGVLVRAITSPDILFVHLCVCVHVHACTVCVCFFYWECSEFTNPFMPIASGPQDWLLSLSCQRTLILKTQTHCHAWRKVHFFLVQHSHSCVLVLSWLGRD